NINVFNEFIIRIVSIQIQQIPMSCDNILRRSSIPVRRSSSFCKYLRTSCIRIAFGSTVIVYSSPFSSC
ncbi:unnamed protein product, partial [Rotaria sp. Silwood2]